MVSQYRCETCKHKDNDWCDLLNRILFFTERDFVSEVGCASHSDFQNQREKRTQYICQGCASQGVTINQISNKEMNNILKTIKPVKKVKDVELRQGDRK